MRPRATGLVKPGKFGRGKCNGTVVGPLCALAVAVSTGKATLAMVLNAGPVYGHCAFAHSAIKARIEWRADRAQFHRAWNTDFIIRLLILRHGRSRSTSPRAVDKIQPRISRVRVDLDRRIDGIIGIRAQSWITEWNCTPCRGFTATKLRWLNSRERSTQACKRVFGVKVIFFSLLFAFGLVLDSG